MAIIDDIQHILSNVGMGALGIAGPLLSVRWTNASSPTSTPTEGDAGRLSLSLIGTSSEEWVAPATGILMQSGGAERILQPNGNPVVPTAVVFRLHPQVYLRLARLYGAILEGLTANTHLPQRPVPYYFVITDGMAASSDLSGKYNAGETLGISGGTLTVHDIHGFAIDPVAVAGAFDAFITEHEVLEARSLLSVIPTLALDRQIHSIASLEPSQARIHLVNPHGLSYDGSHLNGIQPINSDAGLFHISDPTTAITRAGDAPPDLRLGPATTGALDTSFTIRSLASGVTLHRDFVRAMVVDLKPFLIGERPSSDPAASVEPLPQIRHNEVINDDTFSLNGNAALGVANQILTAGSPEVSLVVSPIIKNDFALPTDGSDANPQWPNFPTGLPTTNTPIPASLREGFNPSAHFIQRDDNPTPDVVLTLNGLTPGQAVRVYNRLFLRDAREGRGDGAGAVVRDTTGQVALILKDPLRLVQLGVPLSLPTAATLHVDVVVINSSSKARVFGNVNTAIGPVAPLSPQETALIPSETNPLLDATDTGISFAGILGLPAALLSTVPGGHIRNLIISTLVGPGPQEAPRFPTMARRDALIASLTGSAWRGQISGMHLIADTRNAKPRIGSPGSPGGKEFHTVSVKTQGGPLAYDIARAALRRTRDIVDRLVELNESRWDPPADATAGTLSGAVLQTIAPVAETPEFAPFRSGLEGLRATWADVVDNISSLMPSLPAAFAAHLTNALNSLRTSTKATRLYDEFKREFSASVHGRRDALWALKRAISSARELIYIEGPAFTGTDYAEGSATPENDLVTLIRNRLTAMPGLRVVLCLPKVLDYGPGYEVFAGREFAKRKEIIESFDANRVVAFHPIGFPGRPLRLMTNIVIVDDVWAMVGTSTIRRRGLTFDGGVDIVLFDRNLREGRSLSIANLRKRLMAIHLGIEPPRSGGLPHASLIRLADGYQSFFIFKELLLQGGAGLIEPLFDGRGIGIPEFPGPIDPPSDDVADPDGRDFNTDDGSLALVTLLLDLLIRGATPTPP